MHGIGIAGNGRSDLAEWMFENWSPKPAISGIELNNTSLDLEIGKTSTLSVSALPSSADISGETIAWESSNTSIATVSQEGVVTAVGAGTTKVKATVLGFSAECTINVAEPIYLNETTITIPSGQIKQLTVKSEESLENKAITWSSSDETVVKVDKNGLVTGIKEGTATITVTVEKQTATCKVIVSGQLGDVDNDKDITSYDAYKALEASVDYLIGTDIDEQIILTSDVNKNGVPESEDAYKILKYSVGLIEKF